MIEDRVNVVVGKKKKKIISEVLKLYYLIIASYYISFFSLSITRAKTVQFILFLEPILQYY